MRKQFAEALLNYMRSDESIIIVSGDLGYKMFDKIREEFPDRFINVGAAETVMMGVAVGLAMEGKTPIVYSITPFLLFRAFETIRNYINHEKIPVILVGSGRDLDYTHDGFSHHSQDDRFIRDHFKSISCSWPIGPLDAIKDLAMAIAFRSPTYINLKR